MATMLAKKPAVSRYAFLLVLEYRKVAGARDTPNPLLSMGTDLGLAFSLARDRFAVPPENITVVTDLKVNLGVMNPWDPLSEDPYQNPTIVRLGTPDIGRICQELALFVENTVRGIRSKGDDTTHEVFIYISGHGALVPNPCRHGGNDDEMDNALIFTTEDGRSRRYLRDDQIFKLLFGQIDVDYGGNMSVPITARSTRYANDGSLYHHFTDELVTFRVGAGIRDRRYQVARDDHTPYGEEIVEMRTPNGHPFMIRDRGLPLHTSMLTVIDTCHSGRMTDFHYIFEPNQGKMLLTRKPPCSLYSFPLCVCLAAACDSEDAPSTSSGSTFTVYLYQLFTELKRTVSVQEIHDLIYSRLPRLLERCKPTITSTYHKPDHQLPLLE